MNNINPQTNSTSAYGRLLNLDKHLLSSSNSSLFGGESERNYSLFSGNKVWPTLDDGPGPRSRIPPIENLSIVEINQIQDGLKKLFGRQAQGQHGESSNVYNSGPADSSSAPTPFSPLLNNYGGGNKNKTQNGCGLPTCRTPHCPTAQESCSRLNLSSGITTLGAGTGWASNLNNSWPIMDTDFTYSIGPNVQHQLEKSVIYSNTAQASGSGSPPTQNCQNTISAPGKVSWSALSPNSASAELPNTLSANTLTLHNNHQSLNRDKMRCVVPNFCRSDLTNDPTVFYRFYQFECSCNKKIWFSPLAKAKDGLFCWACTHFVKPFAHFDGTTPYQGSELCYGKFECHICKNTWSSRRSMANVSEKCFGCGAAIYPYYQVTLTTVEKKKRRVENVTFREGMGGNENCYQFMNSLHYSSSPRDSSCDREDEFPGFTRSPSPIWKLKPGILTHANRECSRDREPGIGTPAGAAPRSRLKRSPLGYSISSPAIIQQKLKKDIT